MLTGSSLKKRRATLTERIVGALSAFVLPVAVLVALWFPEYHYYTIESDKITPELVDTARSHPTDSMLNSLSEITYLFDTEEEDLLAEASRVLKEKFTLFSDTTQRFVRPFSPDDLETGTPARRLAMAAEYPATVLVNAYLETGNDSLLISATKAIESFGLYERSAFLPKGYLRNDHATSARAALLTRFWKAYRQHDRYDPKIGEIVLEQAARTSAYLAQNDHFTVSTNHGVMQNLALLQLSLAFPGLPSSEKYFDIALNRLKDQFEFYISGEGVVLEHSAGYHLLGLQFIGSVFYCMKLAGRPIPDSWMQKYNRALRVYISLRRPDHSVPLIGDTDAKQELRYPQVVRGITDTANLSVNTLFDWPSPQPENLYALSGYTVWWDGLPFWPIIDSLTQTTLGYSYFPGHAHKLADEMALYFWKAGTNFWTGAGYWEYGGKGRDYARSWVATNAPHYLRENSPDPVTGGFGSKRETRLENYAYRKKGAFIELLRTIDNSFYVRRQVVKIEDNSWIVLDSYEGLPDGIGRSVWTTAPSVLVTNGQIESSFLLTDSAGRRMTAWFAGSDTNSVYVVRGQQSPMLGWQAYDRKALPATAIVSERAKGDSWSVILFSFEKVTDSQPVIAMNDEDNWAVTMPTVEPTSVTRRGDIVTIVRNKDTTTLSLNKADDVTQSRSRIQEAFTSARLKYKRFRSAIPTRLKISKALLFVLLFQELILLLWRRWLKRRDILVRYLSCFAWILGGIWLIGFYPIL